MLWMEDEFDAAILIRLVKEEVEVEVVGVEEDHDK
jgi:hypothetical protein